MTASSRPPLRPLEGGPPLGELSSDGSHRKGPHLSVCGAPPGHIGWTASGPPPPPASYGYWQYGPEQQGVGGGAPPSWGPPGCSSCGAAGGGAGPPSAGGAGLGASQLAYESELALVHFVVYLVCCIGCVCIYMNYVVLEAHIFALFWAVVFSIPLRAIVYAIAGGPSQRPPPPLPPAAAAAAGAGVAARPTQEQQGRQQSQRDIRRAASATVGPTLFPRQQQQLQQQQQEDQLQLQQQQQLEAGLHHPLRGQRRSSSGGAPSHTRSEGAPTSKAAPSPTGPFRALQEAQAQVDGRRRPVRIKWSTGAIPKHQQQQQQGMQQRVAASRSPSAGSTAPRRRSLPAADAPPAAALAAAAAAATAAAATAVAATAAAATTAVATEALALAAAPEDTKAAVAGDTARTATAAAAATTAAAAAAAADDTPAGGEAAAASHTSEATDTKAAPKTEAAAAAPRKLQMVRRASAPTPKLSTTRSSSSSSSCSGSSSSSGSLVHRNKKRRQGEDSPGQKTLLASSAPPASSSSSSSSNRSRRVRVLRWVCQCVEGICHFVWGSLSVRLSLSSLSLLLLPLQELAGPLPDRSASKPWFGLLHRCCLLLLLQRLFLTSLSLQDLVSALGASLLLLLLLELLLLPLKGNRFLRAPLSWRSRLSSLRPSLLVSRASMDSYVVPLVSVFVIVCFFLAGLLVTAFFCFNIYSELTTLWESAHGLLDRYILRSDSFVDAYQRLSALLQQQQHGLASAAAAKGAVADTASAAADPTPNTLAGFVAAAASAVRSTARSSSMSSSSSGTTGGSSAALLLGGSLGWYSDLWRVIQELASASNAASAAAAAAAAGEGGPPSSTHRPTDSVSSPVALEGPPEATSTSAARDPSDFIITTTAPSLQQRQQQQQQKEQQQSLTSYVSPWPRSSKAQLLLAGLEACPRPPSNLVLQAADVEGPPSLSCVREGGSSLEGPSPACEAESGWWDRAPPPPPAGSGAWAEGVEALLALLEDERTLSCIDPWRGPPGGLGGPRGFPSLGFQWAAARRRRGGGQQVEGGGAPRRGLGSVASFLFSGDLWRRWPNTAELLGHLREGNFLSALKQSLEASQEIYSLTSEAWWKYFSNHAHTLLAWLFNSGFGAWRVCCFVVAFLLRFFLSAFDLLFQFVVFVGALYALLCSPKSTLDLVDEVLCVVDPSAILSASVNEKIRAILFSSVKKVWFYSLFTWFIFESTGMPVVYVPTAVSCLLALLPLLPPETVSILPAVALWLHKEPEQGGPLGGGLPEWGPWFAAPHRLAALCVCGANALVWWNVTTSIYREIPDASPWLVGLSAALGLSTLGLKGIILGPVLATMPLIVISAASKFNDRHIRAQEALGPPDGMQQPQELLQEQQLQPHTQGTPAAPQEPLEGPLVASSLLSSQASTDKVGMPPRAPTREQSPLWGASFCLTEGASKVGDPYFAAWGPSRGPDDAGGFALGERRSARRSNGWAPGATGALVGSGIHYREAAGHSAALPGAPGAPLSASTQGPPPRDAGRGGPIFHSSGSLGAPSSLPFGGPRSSGLVAGGLSFGAPQQPPLALHFLKNAADAIRWVLQRRRPGLGSPLGAPGPSSSMGAHMQYPWGPGPPLFAGSQQQLVLLPNSLSREAAQRPHRAVSLGLGGQHEESDAPAAAAVTAPAAAAATPEAGTGSAAVRAEGSGAPRRTPAPLGAPLRAPAGAPPASPSRRPRSWSCLGP
ncbi:hypothetical protein Efla_006352 [Eimeria flavescens]